MVGIIVSQRLSPNEQINSDSEFTGHGSCPQITQLTLVSAPKSVCKLAKRAPFPRLVLRNMVVASHMWLLKFEIIEIK